MTFGFRAVGAFGFALVFALVLELLRDVVAVQVREGFALEGFLARGLRALWNGRLLLALDRELLPRDLLVQRVRDLLQLLHLALELLHGLMLRNELVLLSPEFLAQLLYLKERGEYLDDSFYWIRRPRIRLRSRPHTKATGFAFGAHTHKCIKKKWSSLSNYS